MSTYIIISVAIALLIALVVIIHIYKAPKRIVKKTIDPIFKKQSDLLERIKEENAMQMDAFDRLNNNIIENYRILHHMRTKELIAFDPNDEDSVFKNQIDLLKQIENETTLQLDSFDKLNRNIVENYRILLQIQLKELIDLDPNDEETILRLYNDYVGIAKRPNASLDELVNNWKKSRSIQ